ncbi:DUF6286 domain-containing protein [Actinomycetospora sp. NBRC 106378]|uniref:DUF6286 domain-containing protein n=1 Tax=Actinomycetospora sp. NBRC 106378 TaxID=3032208 RepID=UPI0024A1F0A1|nr:DUF6286 domain-containing protein [Actinomycetospora sp. NBRC 106378]GLZ55697.1 hypothetical protein Acsp07_53140 [Actinomycetospora sp. NBRC 106378]
MTRRPRRTLPALLVALVLLALGALAATSAIQTLLGRTPVVSLDAVPGALSGVAWESPIVLIVAGVAAVVGLVLLLAAILPGPSHVLPLTAAPATTAPTAGGDAEAWGPWSGSGVEAAGWHRHDLALRLRRRAADVEGVTGATAKVRRRSVKVVARTHRGSTGDLRQAVESALSTDLDSLGLARRPRLRVSVSSTRKDR